MGTKLLRMFGLEDPIRTLPLQVWHGLWRNKQIQQAAAPLGVRDYDYNYAGQNPKKEGRKS